MLMTKHEFIKSFLPEKIEDVIYAQMDLDITDLSIADILRNLNRTYPKNTRNRNRISSGSLAVGILCKTESLDPLQGLLIILTDDSNIVEIVSQNYIIVSIPESYIEDNDEIKLALDKISLYLAKEFGNSIKDFNEFYVKYFYDPYEMESDENE